MSTASHHRRVRLQRLQFIRLDAPVNSGGLVAGPRALRSERLQWLTTSAVNIQVFLTRRSCFGKAPGKMWSGAVALREALPQKHAGSGHRAIWSSGRSAMQTQIAASSGLFRSRGQRRRVPTGLPRQGSRASAHLFLKILIGPEARAGTSPPAFLFWVLP